MTSAGRQNGMSGSEPDAVVTTTSTEGSHKKPDESELLAPPVVDDEVSSSTSSGLGGSSKPTYKRETIGGRTYQTFKEESYMLPNDKPEQQRLDVQHVLFGMTIGEKLNLSPIENTLLANVLDIACGTGLWTVEFAKKYPKAQILGTDLSAIQPTDVPPNCRFEITDAEKTWNFSTRFNYIHGRALLTCFIDPSFVIRQAFNALEPGGYFELQDILVPMQYAGLPPVKSHLYEWNKLIIEGAAKGVRVWDNVQYYKKWFEEAGFEDVVEKTFYWPTSPWAKGEHYKKLSKYVQENYITGIEGMSLRAIGQLGWSADEIKDFLVGVREDFLNTSIHAYMPIRVVYGRKPKVLG